MCLMCVEILKDRMTIREVVRATREFKIPEDHVEEFTDLLSRKFTLREFAQAVSDAAEENKSDS